MVSSYYVRVMSSRFPNTWVALEVFSSYWEAYHYAINIIPNQLMTDVQILNNDQKIIEVIIPQGKLLVINWKQDGF